jgi:hypothetical protein
LGQALVGTQKTQELKQGFEKWGMGWMRFNQIWLKL